LKEYNTIPEELMSVFHSLGWDMAQFSQSQRIQLRAGMSKREYCISFLSLESTIDLESTPALEPAPDLESTPFLCLAMPVGFPVVEFEEFYPRYTDFNFEIYLLLAHLDRTSIETSYLMYFDEHRLYLYDVGSQECLIYCSTPKEREDKLYPHLERKHVESGSLDNITRKSNHQLATELNGWFNIWSADIGSKTHAKKKVLEQFSRKMTLARYYRNLFGNESPYLLFEAFVNDPAHLDAAMRTSSPVKFIKKLFLFFKTHFSLDLFTLEKAEKLFLKKAEEKGCLLNHFLVEFNFLSREKFSLEVFLTAWLSDEERSLSTKKSYTTAKDNITKYFFAEDIMVLKPVLSNISENGVPWALSLFDRIVQYWINYNLEAEMKGNEKSGKKYQPDLFVPIPDDTDKDGRIVNLVNHSLKTSFRVTGVEHNSEKELILAILTAKCFEIWKKYNITREPVEISEKIFDSPLL
jgi:hypothetical protein